MCNKRGMGNHCWYWGERLRGGFSAPGSMLAKEGVWPARQAC